MVARPARPRAGAPRQPHRSPAPGPILRRPPPSPNRRCRRCRSCPKYPNLFIVDHPLILHKADAYAAEGALDPGLPRTPQGDFAADGLRDHPRPADDDRADRNPAGGPWTRRWAGRQEGWRLVSILRAGLGIGRGAARADPLGARGAYRPLPGSGDQDAGGIPGEAAGGGGPDLSSWSIRCWRPAIPRSTRSTC